MVVTFCDDLVLVHDNTSDRNLAGVEGALGLVKGLAHKLFVSVYHCVEILLCWCEFEAKIVESQGEFLYTLASCSCSFVSLQIFMF